MYKLKTWKEAASVLAQATDTLARAEQACEFEVRQLASTVAEASLTELSNSLLLEYSIETCIGATFSFDRP